jgi:hypothetical protein
VEATRSGCISGAPVSSVESALSPGLSALFLGEEVGWRPISGVYVAYALAFPPAEDDNDA